MKINIKKLAEQLRKDLQEDILNRYDNSEYWDIEVAEAFYQNNQLSGEEIQEIIGRLDF